MIESERKQIIDLIKKEVIPAIGCTEPIAVALCVAKAAETDRSSAASDVYKRQV